MTTTAKDAPVQLTSKSGASYRSGVEPSLSIQKAGFAVDVNWPPSEEWVNLPQDVANATHITRYKLVENPLPPPDSGAIYFQWTRFFTNTAHYDFFFEDKTHDEYENDRYINRDHYTDYNSADPTIIRVRGV
ncbi:hypothetical protein QBC42DRAFT_286009 [Cladorrhinum samala]|uniref:Uncharacterized protein n=1 Tax=Cladorrhinum samala TaxID=585594 RepID=A0AAV9HT78_9PEZI|nr:hypothetical protein QBC42DRAFT_286009 [Cladorrhinum samala]